MPLSVQIKPTERHLQGIHSPCDAEQLPGIDIPYISVIKFNQWTGVCLISICRSCELCPAATFGPRVAVTGPRHMFEAAII